MGMFIDISRNGKITVPNGSMCLTGLKESLPDPFAVGSPSLYAANAWLASWQTIAVTKLITEQMRYGQEGSEDT